MREAALRRWRVRCPAPEVLVPHALGDVDAPVARHVEGCPTCRAEVARLRDAAGLLRERTAQEHLRERPDCLDELAVADFVEGRLGPEARALAVAHLLRCARCRSAVRAAGSLLADQAVASDLAALSGVAGIPGSARVRWRRRRSLPLGVAAAAAVLLFLWPRSGNDRGPVPELREPAITSTVAPLPVVPLASVSKVDRLVWTSVPRAEHYRVRLYDEKGSVLWRAETADTSAALPDSVRLSPGGTYFWKVEALTEWRRWAASDLVEFRLMGRRR
jgi:hypothetical protein